MHRSFQTLRNEIVCCRKCPRLVKFRESVPERKSFKDQKYWRRPAPGFGDPKASLLILGLAPSAHGGNRTGRIFTGDASGKFLMEALYHAGFANQSTSESKDDGLILKGCYITAAVKCVPPKNNPLALECDNCRPYLLNELYLLKSLKNVLALGKLAFDRAAFIAKQHLGVKEKIHFAHGKKVQFKNLFTLYGSYHPSPQNTYTGKLTLSGLISILKKI